MFLWWLARYATSKIFLVKVRTYESSAGNAAMPAPFQSTKPLTYFGATAGRRIGMRSPAGSGAVNAVRSESGLVPTFGALLFVAKTRHPNLELFRPCYDRASTNRPLAYQSTSGTQPTSASGSAWLVGCRAKWRSV